MVIVALATRAADAEDQAERGRARRRDEIGADAGHRQAVDLARGGAGAAAGTTLVIV